MISHKSDWNKTSPQMSSSTQKSYFRPIWSQLHVAKLRFSSKSQIKLENLKAFFGPYKEALVASQKKSLFLDWDRWSDPSWHPFEWRAQRVPKQPHKSHSARGGPDNSSSSFSRGSSNSYYFNDLSIPLNVIIVTPHHKP